MVYDLWSVIGATVETGDRSGGASVALRFGVWRMAPNRLPIARPALTPAPEPSREVNRCDLGDRAR
jgi:hypothetical protein